MKRLLAVLAILTFPVLSFAADIDCDADSDNQMDLSCGGTNADTAANARTSLGVPATAATLVGSCTAGPCLDGTSDGGDLIKLYGSLGFWTSLQAGAATANVNWRLPLANPAAGTTRIINTDEYGNMGLLDPATFLTPSGAGGSLTFTASGFNGNLLTTTDTLQELADAVDNLSISGYTNLTSFVAQTPWKLFYSNTDGDVVELGFGNDGEYLKSNGAALAPSWATPSGAAHDAVTLDTEVAAIFSLSTQQLTLDSQTANYFWAAPNGSAGDPVFRAIVAADIPTLNQNTTGTSAGLSGTPNITVGTISAGATGFSVDADGDVTAKSYLTSAADGSRRSELPNNTSITPLGGGVEEIYNEGGAIKAVENDTEYDIMLSRDIGGAIQAYDADLDDLADGSLTGSKVSAASDSAAGVSELATTAETNTGTSTSLTVTPDGLSGSVYGQKEIGWYVIASDTVTAVADGKQAAVVPASMNGMNLVDMTCSVHDLNSAASGNTTVVLRRVRGATAADMTSTGVTIAYTDYTASDETVDTANDDLATGDKIYVDVNAITTAAQKGLSCTAIFQTP